MRILHFGPETAQPIELFESLRASSRELGAGSGEVHVHGVHFEPGGKIGRHPTGFAQLFLIVQGRGWAAGGDGERVSLEAGQGVFFERGEEHEKGSEEGAVAILVQVDELQAAT